jgi:UDP-2,3-diacylglucosamine pyrophosphatase LpxH
MNTLIVSDVHMGSRVTRARELYELLKSLQITDHDYRFERLILLGDIFNDMNFRRLRKYEWRLLGLIRKMTDEESHVKVAWVRGNHDLELIDLMTHMVGIPIYEEYRWQVNGKRFLAMHGDQFDKWIVNYPVLSAIPTYVYDLIQKLDGPRHKLSRLLKDRSKKWLHINQAVARGILQYARSRRLSVDALFCGHTHLADAIHFEAENVWYYNTGCWTGSHPPTYAVVDGGGEVTLHEYTSAGVAAHLCPAELDACQAAPALKGLSVPQE